MLLFKFCHHLLIVQAKLEKINIVLTQRSRTNVAPTVLGSSIQSRKSSNGSHTACSIVTHREGWHYGFIKTHGLTLCPRNSSDTVCDLLPTRSRGPRTSVPKA